MTKNKALEIFSSVTTGLLQKLEDEMKALQKDLHDDYDQTDLEVFVPLVISSFSALQAGLFAAKLCARELDILQHHMVSTLADDVEGLQSHGCKLLVLMITKGKTAIKSD